MKKRKKQKELKVPLSNPVAKFAYHFNKAKVFKDKTKYQRKAKHKESFPIVLFFQPSLEKILLSKGLNIKNGT